MLEALEGAIRAKISPCSARALFFALVEQEDEMQQWLLAIFGVAAAGVGHLLKRWLDRDAAAEKLNRRLRALDLLRGLRRERLSLRELDHFIEQANDRK